MVRPTCRRVGKAFCGWRPAVVMRGSWPKLRSVHGSSGVWCSGRSGRFGFQARPAGGIRERLVRSLLGGVCQGAIPDL